MKMHHVKHAGFFLAVLMILGAGVISIQRGLSNVQAAGGVTLDANVTATQGAKITSSPAGISCPGDCDHTFAEGTNVTMTITLTKPNVKFIKWRVYGVGGPGTSCGSATTCSWSLDANDNTDGDDNYYSITAYVDPKYTPLTVKTSGVGSGKVKSNVAGLNGCTDACTANVNDDQTVTLIAEADAGSVFKGWKKYDEGGRACILQKDASGKLETHISSAGGKGGATFAVDKRLTSAACSDSIVLGWQYDDDETYVPSLGPAIAHFEKVVTSDDTSDDTETEEKPEQTETTKPEAEHTIKDLKFNDTDIETTNEDGQKIIKKPTFEPEKPIKLSGQTVPNGVVKLFIFSEPQEAEVKADGNGFWEHVIQSIEEGEHRVEVAVTDPATGKTTERAVLGEFTVAQTSPTAAQQQAAAQKSSGIGLIAAGVLAVLGVGYLAWYWWHHKASILTHHQKKATAGSSTIVPDTQSKDNGS